MDRAVPCCVHFLAERVRAYVQRQGLLHAGDRVGVAVSGGIDSVALFRLLLELRGELGIVLAVVHFNHKLRGAESDADQEFVGSLAREPDLELYCDTDDVAGHAVAERISVETAARELRYGFFHFLLGADGEPQGLRPDSSLSAQRGAEAPLFHGTAAGADGSYHSLANQNRLDKILTGHTLDDQAETVLMRMIRGAGVRGLGGIYPRIAVEDDDGDVCGEIIRPLLGIRRRELEQYLKDIGQGWREDSSNADDAFTRNRVRQLVVPLLEKEFNPAVVENLAELAAIARGEEDYWENEVAGWMGTAVHWSEPEWGRSLSAKSGLVQISSPTVESQNPRLSQKRGEAGHPEDDLSSRIDSAPWLVMNASVDRLWFLGEPEAVQRRLVKAIGEQAGIPLEFKHVEEILRFASDESSGKEISLPRGWKVIHVDDELVFLTPDLRENSQAQDYEYELSIPGEIVIAEIGSTIAARLIPANEVAEHNPDQLFDAAVLAGPLRVRNWRAGDRFWPAHTKSPRKVKELLQERHVPQPERKLWPVIVSGNSDEIVWMRGFPVPAQFGAKFQEKPSQMTLLITETPTSQKSQ
jgi:tRNA(Ile)-lysidine synthase